MKCQVTSDTTRKVMISREVKVASYKEICGGEKIRVHLGYNNDPLYMKVENNKLLQHPRSGAFRFFKIQCGAKISFNQFSEQDNAFFKEFVK